MSTESNTAKQPKQSKSPTNIIRMFGGQQSDTEETIDFPPVEPNFIPAHGLDESQNPGKRKPWFANIGDNLYYCRMVEKVKENGKKFAENENKEFKREDIRIGPALYIRAFVRDQENNAWGKLLEWRDPDDLTHTINMPMSALPATGNPWLSLLADGGYYPASTDKFFLQLLKGYLEKTQPSQRARTVTKIGWHGDNFVFPMEAIGNTTERIILQNASSATNAMFGSLGTMEGWQELAGFAAGNSRLVFAISTALAGPLLYVSGLESGGFSFVGASSTGKSTALRLAASVWGGPNHVKSWRTTDNSLESTAALHNDSLLVMDELGQAPAKAVGEMSYMLANGAGKGRARRDGSARAIQTWRLLFLSSGEVGLADKLAEIGQKPKAGQEVRFIDLAGDAGVGFGIFENTHGKAPGELANIIRDMAAQHHGHAGKAFVRYILDGGEKRGERIKGAVAKFVWEICSQDADGQVRRVAARFALAAVAGVLATEAGILPFQPMESWHAAASLFQAWINSRGGAGAAEDRMILDEIKWFVERHGQSRFQNLNPREDADGNPIEQTVINRAGFREETDEGSVYYVLEEAWKNEVLKGFNAKYGARLAEQVGLLVRTEPDKIKTKKRLPGMGQTYCYKLFLPVIKENDS